MSRASREQSLFLTLDGMRGVGAILVVVGHSFLFWGGFPTYPPIPFCVDLFFMLSGYVIAFAYEPRFAQGMTAMTFLRQRFVRLYPLYFLGLLIGAAVHFYASLGDASKMAAVGVAFIPSALGLPSPDLNGSGDLYPLNMPSWTLLFELWANLVFVLIWRWLSTRVLIVVVALSAVVLAVCAISYGTIDQGPSWWNFWGGFARAMFGFFVGVLVFRWSGSPAETPKKISWQAIPALFAVPLLCFIPQTPETRPFVELAIVCLIGPVLLWWGQTMQPWAPLARLFGWLGAVSYAVYVLHYPFYEFIKRVAYKFPQLYQDFAPWSGMLILAVAVAAATAAERWYDRPVRRALNGLLKSVGKRKPRPMAHAE